MNIYVVMNMFYLMMSLTFQVIANGIAMNVLYALKMETIIMKKRKGNEIPTKIALEMSENPGNKRRISKPTKNGMKVKHILFTNRSKGAPNDSAAGNDSPTVKIQNGIVP